MVNERDPPRATELQPQPLRVGEDLAGGLQFGTASPIRNPLSKERSSAVFYKPKPYQAHKEHHRPIQASASTEMSRNLYPQANPSFRQPTFHHRTSQSPDVVEIPRPSNLPPRTIPAAHQQLFSTGSNFVPANAWKTPATNTVDLTRTDNDAFNPDRALGIDKYGSFDPSNFMDSAKASENIKALLEGAFEDDEDKPKTRLRKKKQDRATEALTEKMDNLKVAGDTEIRQDEQEVEDDDGTVEGLSVKLLPHQIDGVAWMLDKEIGTRKKNGVLPKGGILADDMGLGKTIQALSLVLSNPRPSAEDIAENPKLKIPEAAGKGTLIIAPLALIKQWESEIKTKVDTFPRLKVLVHHGASRTKRYEDLKKYDIVITTYQTLSSEHSDSSPDDKGLKVGCFGVHWYRVILDEAHSIKNRNAKMTKAAYDLRSVYRWCLTGTPMQNNLDELQSLIRFLRIKPYNDMANWREQIGQPMRNGRGGLAMKRLQYFLKAFMKRRTKDVLKQNGALNFGRQSDAANGKGSSGGFKIMARNVETIVIDFEGAEREFYRKLEARTEKNLAAMMSGARNDYMGALVLLLRLRQACNHPRLIRGNLVRDKESISEAQHPNLRDKPQQSQSGGSDDLDDVANLFNAMTVATQKCDSCCSKLSREEVNGGLVRCNECESDFQTLQVDSHQKRQNRKAYDKGLRKNQEVRRRRRVIESDDDEDTDDGHERREWIVPKEQQTADGVGKAGGKDDEDAEGRGRWLGDDDSNSEAETSTTTMDTFIEDDGGAKDDRDAESDNESGSDISTDSAANHVDQRNIPSTKIRRLIKILEEESDEHKFIVFSEFTSMLDIIEPFLCSAGFCFTRYDGSMKNDDREASLERLRKNSRVRILLCSLKCGSLGLNLTAASRVVILEPFWNPFVEEQAIDRVHRLNQTRDVTVYRLTIANTVEERIIALQEKKRELAKAAIEGGGVVGKLSMQDILKLFKHDAEHDAEIDDARAQALGTDIRFVSTRRPVTTSSPKKSTSTTPAFRIPKSLEQEYAAYTQRDPFTERR